MDKSFTYRYRIQHSPRGAITEGLVDVLWDSGLPDGTWEVVVSGLAGGSDAGHRVIEGHRKGLEACLAYGVKSSVEDDTACEGLSERWQVDPKKAGRHVGVFAVGGRVCHVMNVYEPQGRARAGQLDVDEAFEVYRDDGEGNGDFVGEATTLEAAKLYARRCVVSELDRPTRRALALVEDETDPGAYGQ